MQALLLILLLLFFAPGLFVAGLVFRQGWEMIGVTDAEIISGVIGTAAFALVAAWQLIRGSHFARVRVESALSSIGKAGALLVFALVAFVFVLAMFEGQPLDASSGGGYSLPPTERYLDRDVSNQPRIHQVAHEVGGLITQLARASIAGAPWAALLILVLASIPKSSISPRPRSSGSATPSTDLTASISYCRALGWTEQAERLESAARQLAEGGKSRPKPTTAFDETRSGSESWEQRFARQAAERAAARLRG